MHFAPLNTQFVVLKFSSCISEAEGISHLPSKKIIVYGNDQSVTVRCH
jgi:hypothetical protein